MTAEVRERLDRMQLDRAKYAYLELRDIYEECAGGVAGARNYQEYMAICSNIARINAEFERRKG